MPGKSRPSQVRKPHAILSTASAPKCPRYIHNPFVQKSDTARTSTGTSI